MSARVLLLLLLHGAAIVAIQPTLTLQAIDEAIRLGQTGVERDRTAFHGPYRLPLARPPVDHIDVITPFRRIVLVAEQSARAGDRSFGQRQALQRPDLLAAEIELRVELTFHPQNTFVGVPPYEVVLAGPGNVRIPPRSLERAPRYTPRLDGSPNVTPLPGGAPLPRGSQPILGGVLSARFDLSLLSVTGVYDVVISEQQTETARAKLDLGRLR